MFTRQHARVLRSSLLAVSVWFVGAGCSSSEPDGSSAGSGPAASAGDGDAAGGGDGGAGGGDGGAGAGDGGAGGSDGGDSSTEDPGTTQTPGTHFAATSTAWSLPAGAPGTYGFDEIANSMWTTMDLDGDGKPDLVVNAGAAESNRRWLFYKNTP